MVFWNWNFKFKFREKNGRTQPGRSLRTIMYAQLVFFVFYLFFFSASFHLGWKIQCGVAGTMAVASVIKLQDSRWNYYWIWVWIFICVCRSVAVVNYNAIVSNSRRRRYNLIKLSGSETCRTGQDSLLRSVVEVAQVASRRHCLRGYEASNYLLLMSHLNENTAL